MIVLRTRVRLLFASLSGIGAILLALALPAPVAAHGFAPAPESLITVLLAWQLEAHVILPLAAAALVYHWAVGKVDRAHANNPVPRFRYWCWEGGIFVLLLALASPIATYDTTLF